MSNPFQEQLLKAGLVSKQQVQQVNKEKQKKKKQQKSKKPVLDEAALRAQKAVQEKAQRDRELNEKKQQQARARAISAEINQMILEHMLQRDDSCDLVYNFEHDRKVKRIYINQQMKQQLIDGTLALARIDGRYELVPLSVAEKIKQRNEKRVIIFEPEDKQLEEDDPYADFQVPDDLIW
ncbi:MAG TPA: DUF2058 domain-containing protein [Gammaproteobacteria bacterium]